MHVLHDLRRLALAAENVAILWVMAAEAGQAVGDDELVKLANECQAEMEAQVEALVAQIRAAAPQSLVSA
jgi:hypothetical protein